MVLACAGCGTQETESTEQSDNFSAVDVYTVGEGTKSEAEEKKDDYEDAGQKEAGGEVAEFAGLIQAAVADKDMEALADLCKIGRAHV